MVTHYDMASCEMILDPQNESFEVTAEPAPVELRLQTVAEAIAIETQVSIPADLLLLDPSVFVDGQS